jgi:pyrimidine-nucleoside phosphorylase
MLIVSNVESDEAVAERRVRDAIRTGAGIEKFRQIISNQGGDPQVIDDYGRLPAVADRHEIRAPRSGYVTALAAEHVGRAAVALGAGRAKLDDLVDPAVGIEVTAPPGSEVRSGEPVLVVQHRAGRGLTEAVPLLTAAVQIADVPPVPLPIVVADIREERR